jgi:hypothetical protein
VQAIGTNAVVLLYPALGTTARVALPMAEKGSM